LGTREARSKLARRHKPYWREITPGLQVGYRKGTRGGIWKARLYAGAHKYREWSLGTADDIVDSNGVEILSFTEADAKARAGLPERVDSQLDTVADAMDFYLVDQKERAKGAKATEYTIESHI